MRIVLFCENKYAIDILHPIQLEADREGGNEVLWYVHEKKIPDFPLKHEVRLIVTSHKALTSLKSLRSCR